MSKIYSLGLILVCGMIYAAGSFELNGNSLVLKGTIIFETGSAKVKAESDAALNFVKSYLVEKSYVSLLRIEVHTDNTGSADQNQKLTEARALSVAKALVARGVDCKRLLPVGFGSSKPVAANDTPEGKARNRRTEFVNAALRGRAIGGMPVDGGGKVAGDACR